MYQTTYLIQNCYYANESTTSILNKLKLTDEETKAIYDKYNHYDYLVEIEKIVL